MARTGESCDRLVIAGGARDAAVLSALARDGAIEKDLARFELRAFDELVRLVSLLDAAGAAPDRDQPARWNWPPSVANGTVVDSCAVPDAACASASAAPSRASSGGTSASTFDDTVQCLPSASSSARRFEANRTRDSRVAPASSPGNARTSHPNSHAAARMLMAVPPRMVLTVTVVCGGVNRAARTLRVAFAHSRPTPLRCPISSAASITALCPRCTRLEVLRRRSLA